MSVQEGTPPPQISFEDLVNKSLEEANEALKDPYVFKSDIKKVAVIGAGPSGVSHGIYGCVVTGIYAKSICVFCIVGIRKTLKGSRAFCSSLW